MESDLELSDCFDYLIEQIKLRIEKAAGELQQKKIMLKIINAEKRVILQKEE